MKKVLFAAKVDSHIRHFHIPFLKEFKKRNYEVHVMSEGMESFDYSDKKYDVHFGSNPFSKRNKNNFQTIRDILIKNKYDIIHTHTAIASVLIRLAVFTTFKRSERPRVIYTAHGFHFLKGGKKSSWFLYFPIEYILSQMTDDLILINKEDYQLAEKTRMGRKRYFIPGVGVNFEHFKRSFSYHKTPPFVITYVAELNENKNQKLLIEAFEKAQRKNPSLQLLLVGEGEYRKKLEAMTTRKGLSHKISFLGYRTDIRDILEKSNLVVATSKREGLPINLIEAMAMELPIIATRCRGHKDLVDDGINGFLVNYDSNEIAEKILKLASDIDKCKAFGEASFKKAQEYNLDNVIEQMNKIYFKEEKED